MSYGRMNSLISIAREVVTKDAEGFATKTDQILVSSFAYREGRHGSQKWVNRAAFSEATDLFRFRTIPGLTVTTEHVILFKKNRSMSDALMNKVGVVFSISSIANTVWIFTWHYRIIALSMVLMIIILVCLAIIVSAIRKETLSTKEKVFVKLPFSVYFGWITVATIANLTTLLVSVGWNGFGLSQTVWAIAIIAIGAAIGIITILRNKDYAYGLVILWAYAGIVIKHVSETGFNSMYPAVMITTIAAMVLVVVAEVMAITKKAY